MPGLNRLHRRRPVGALRASRSGFTHVPILIASPDRENGANAPPRRIPCVTDQAVRTGGCQSGCATSLCTGPRTCGHPYGPDEVVGLRSSPLAPTRPHWTAPVRTAAARPLALVGCCRPSWRTAPGGTLPPGPAQQRRLVTERGVHGLDTEGPPYTLQRGPRLAGRVPIASCG
jgi:hypothetical protein